MGYITRMFETADSTIAVLIGMGIPGLIIGWVFIASFFESFSSPRRRR